MNSAALSIRCRLHLTSRSPSGAGLTSSVGRSTTPLVKDMPPDPFPCRISARFRIKTLPSVSTLNRCHPADMRLRKAVHPGANRRCGLRPWAPPFLFVFRGRERREKGGPSSVSFAHLAKTMLAEHGDGVDCEFDLAALGARPVVEEETRRC